VLGLAAALVLGRGTAVADPGACGQLVYTFQPDCYRGTGSATCVQTLQHLDLGPQIAVWIETNTRSLVDTLMVTNLTASRGIGNRPGIWNFRSGPKFPYGKRWMSLPLWAYARGRLYGAAMMQDDREDWMGFHEAHSSKELYFCRPFTQQDVDLTVDTITCPSQMFNSAKGKLDPSKKSYYPPRNDLTIFTNQDCDVIGQSLPKCNVSASGYAALNDLDAVAAATPAYGRPYARTWRIPENLPPGDYALVVEVSKEYDTNASHSHPGFDDVHGGLSAYGIDGNFGQPSVLYRVPIRLGGSTPTTAAVSQIAGYSKWTEDEMLDGTLLPRDGTISTATPGSGEARLLEIDGPSGRGRVHVELQRCGAPTCGEDGGCGPDGSQPDGSTVPQACTPLPPVPEPVSSLQVVSMLATSASVEFLNASADGKAVESYEIRYRPGTTMTVDDFEQAIPASIVQPDAPGTTAMLTVTDLKPATQYMLGIRSIDQCQQRSEIAVVPLETPVMKFRQLSGCFIATAAYGSEMEPRVAALRHARDRLRPRSSLFAAATDLYYRSGPAAADLVARSEVARALARRVLGPLVGMAEVMDAIGIQAPRRGPK
jgi:Fibronectin type III domain